MTVSNNLALFDLLSHFDQRTLIDRCVLVCAPELLQPEPVVLHESRERFSLRARSHAPGIDNHFICGDFAHHAGTWRNFYCTGVASRLFLQPGSNQRSLREKQWNRLPLHVTAHQGAVGVIVLQERDESRSN